MLETFRALRMCLRRVNCVCNSAIKDITVELEGAKFDVTILDAKLFSLDSKLEADSDDINSLRIKQKDM